MKNFQDDEIIASSGSSIKELIKDSALMLIPVAIIVILIFSFF